MKTISNLPNITAPNTERPDGALKDVTSPGAGDGTPAREDWLNDLYYALLATMKDVGVSSDDSDESVEAGTGTSQFLSAMRTFSSQYAYPGIDQGQNDISAGNQTTDLTPFEAGGASEKKDGYTVHVRWTGGDASFNHQLVSAYTVGNEMAGFITATLWKGEGSGELVLRLDKTNSKWLVLSPGAWDVGANTDGNWEKYVQNKMLCWVTRSPGNGVLIVWTFPSPFSSGAVSWANSDSATGSYASTAGSTATSLSAIRTSGDGSSMVIYASGPWG